MIRVAHVITGLRPGGAELMLHKLLTRMDRSRFRTVVIGLGGGDGIAETLRGLDVDVQLCDMPLGLPSAGSLARLAMLLRGLRVDLIQGWMYHGNLAALAGMALAPGSPPVLWNIRGSSYILSEEKPVTAATIWLGARLSHLPSTIICNSTSAARLHQQHLHFARDRWEIVPNGFDLDRFKPSADARRELRAELSLAPETPLIGLIGRYHATKDQPNFLRAAALLGEPGVHFVLAGKDVDAGNDSLRRLIGELNLAGVVHLLGERHDIPRVTAALDIAACSSYAESFPNVIGEAMSSEVPCAVTEVGDSAWIVGDTGSVVPPRDPNALAAALAAMLALTPETRGNLGAAARRRIAEHFSLDAVAARYETIYEQALQRPILAPSRLLTPDS